MLCSLGSLEKLFCDATDIRSQLSLMFEFPGEQTEEGATFLSERGLALQAENPIPAVHICPEAHPDHSLPCLVTSGHTPAWHIWSPQMWILQTTLAPQVTDS